jgi:methionine sulfoxide reductase heme-binding subunit
MQPVAPECAGPAAVRPVIPAWALCGLACAAPAAWLALGAATDALGPHPLNRLLHVSGRTALVLLLVTLCVTPARRLCIAVAQHLSSRWGKRISDWNGLVRLRRQLGLFVAFYASLHVGLYVALDVTPDVELLLADVRERPLVLVGLASFVLVAVLAATSNAAAMRALGPLWRRLHTLSYVAAVLALVHFWLQVKVGQAGPWFDTIVLAALLVLRVQAWRTGARAPAVEVHR